MELEIVVLNYAEISLDWTNYVSINLYVVSGSHESEIAEILNRGNLNFDALI